MVGFQFRGEEVSWSPPVRGLGRSSHEVMVALLKARLGNSRRDLAIFGACLLWYWARSIHLGPRDLGKRLITRLRRIMTNILSPRHPRVARSNIYRSPAMFSASTSSSASNWSESAFSQNTMSTLTSHSRLYNGMYTYPSIAWGVRRSWK